MDTVRPPGRPRYPAPCRAPTDGFVPTTMTARNIPRTPPGPDRAALTVVLVTVGAYGLMMGMAPPLIAVALDARGHSGTVVGLNAAMPAFGQFLASAFIVVGARRFGIRKLLAACLAADAILIASLAFLDGLGAWFAVRLMTGATLNSVLILSETWVNVAAPAHARGRVLGLYNGIMAAAMAVGPLLLTLIGTAGTVPFLVAASFALAAMAPTLLVRTEMPRLHGQGAASPLILVRVLPVATFAALMFAWREIGGMALVPLHGMRAGLEDAEAMLGLTIAGIGGIALQYPIGWLADRFGARRTLLGAASVALVTSALMAVVATSMPAYAAVLFVWGGAYAGLYTVVLVMVGETFTGHRLVAANAGLGIVWGVGHLTGPSLMGVAMDRTGTLGLPLVFVGGLVCLIALALALPHHATSGADTERGSKESNR